MTKRSIAVALGLIAFGCELSARVIRVEILSKADVLEGKAFGDAGAYEKIIGKIHFAVKPDDPHNKVVVDSTRPSGTRPAKSNSPRTFNCCVRRTRRA